MVEKLVLDHSNYVIRTYLYIALSNQIFFYTYILKIVIRTIKLHDIQLANLLSLHFSKQHDVILEYNRQNMKRESTQLVDTFMM